MPEEFESPDASKLENDTVSSESGEQAIERIAADAAQKSSLKQKKNYGDYKDFSICHPSYYSPTD